MNLLQFFCCGTEFKRQEVDPSWVKQGRQLKKRTLALHTFPVAGITASEVSSKVGLKVATGSGSHYLQLSSL